MTDAELRALVRDAVARHLDGTSSAPRPRLGAPGVHSASGADAPGLQASPRGDGHPWREHASHHIYLSVVNVDGSCVIEPSVPCDHCGYCRSHGH